MGIPSTILAPHPWTSISWPGIVMLLHSGLVTFRIHFPKPKQSSFVVFVRLGERVHDSQNQLFRMLETPKLLQAIQDRFPIHFREICFVENFTICDMCVLCCWKNGNRAILNIRLIDSWKCWTWAQYPSAKASLKLGLFEISKFRNFQTLKLWNLET